MVHDLAVGVPPARAGTGVDAAVVLARHVQGTLGADLTLRSARGRGADVVGQAGAAANPVLALLLTVWAAGVRVARVSVRELDHRKAA